MNGVSVLIAAYNAETTIGAAIESVLAQTGIACEIIVIDDCSVDATYDVACDYARRHDTIRVLPTPANAGPSAARNMGIDAATGEWVAILDADDTMEPDRLASMAAYGTSEKADIVFDNMLTVENGERKTFLTRPLPAVIGLRYFVLNNISYLSHPSIGYLKPLLRRAFLLDRDLRYDAALFNSEDYLLILEMLAQGGRCVYLPSAGYHYHIHNTSVSAKFKQSQNAAFIEAEKNFLARHRTRLTADEEKALRRHILYRILSEPIYRCIEAIKVRDARAFSDTLRTLSMREKAAVLRALALVIMRRIFYQKSRF